MMRCEQGERESKTLWLYCVCSEALLFTFKRYDTYNAHLCFGNERPLDMLHKRPIPVFPFLHGAIT